jgi:glycine dehydrogenase subunit 2
MREPVLIFERSRPGRRGTQVRPKADAPAAPPQIPPSLLRTAPLLLPEVSELDLVRHYVKLSQSNYGVDSGFYPLGSCTMKYNPKAAEAASALPLFAQAHPLQPEHTMQGLLKLLYDVQQWMADFTGMDAVSLQPAAGAQGELAGMIIFRKHFDLRGERERSVMLVPDSAHGTNPASAHIAGFEIGEVKAVDHGGIMTLPLLEQAIAAHGAERIAGIMLTNPSTLGTFEENILAVAARLHEIGAQLYYDGANLNATLGIARPGDMGFDLVHLNAHKTFSTPHGGGGPGSGPIGVKAHLAELLPTPVVVRQDGAYAFAAPAQSIGRMKLFHGQFLVLVRTWAYVLLNGPDGLRRVGENAVLAANYLQARLKDAYDIPFAAYPGGRPRPCMHEFVASAQRQAAHGVRALDLAKALLNDGFHAPTVYFPLIVHEALMIEPTETESLETLDAFAEAMLKYAALAEQSPEELKALPNLRVKHLDEVHAARNLNVRWKPEPPAQEQQSGAG